MPTKAERIRAIRSLIKPAVAEAAADPAVPIANTTAGVAEAADAIAEAAASDPVVVNQMSLEEPHQSRLTWAGISGMIISFVALVRFIVADLTDADGFNFLTFDFFQFLTMLGTFGASAYVIYGRWWPNLKPLFWDPKA